MMSKEKIKNFFADVFTISENKATNTEIKASITSGTKLKGTNMCILICAIIIASIGLNMNSTGIVIGAMLISPMMGAIMGVGYALATNDLKFAKRAFVALLIQIIISVIASTLYFRLTPISKTSSELLARTMPTIWDVIIAIFGGLAGAIGMTRKEKANILPGVAIATGLMPPLCTTGFGIAIGQLKYIAGALYLFFINAFFICLSCVIVFKIMKMPKKRGADQKEEKKIKRNLAIVAIITIIPSVMLGYQIVKETVINSNVQKYIETEFQYENTQVVKSSVELENKKIKLALIGKVLDENEILTLTNQLKKYNLQDMTLKITQTEVAGGINQQEIQEIIKNELGKTNSSLLTGKVTDTKETTSETIADKITEVKDKVISNAEEIKKQVKERFSVIQECTITNSKTTIAEGTNMTTTTIAKITLKQSITPEENKQIDKFLKEKLGEDVVIDKEIQPKS